MKTPTIIKIITPTLIVIAALAIGYIEPNYSLITTANHATYVGFDNYDFKIDVEEGYYSVTDQIGLVKDCSSERFPACITFGSTIILIPKSSYFEQSDRDDFVEGVTDNNLTFEMYPSSINVFGKKFSGYRFIVGMDDMTFLTGRNVNGIYGNYFYSLDYGVLLFDDYNVVINPMENSKKLEIYTLWAKYKCGLFSRSKCLKL